MALKNQAITVEYYAWNTSTNSGQTADAGNHTLKLIQDGTEAAPTNSPAEVNSTTCPGLYKLALTAGDMNFNVVTLAGKSSTANVVIIGPQIVTERGVLPSAAPNASGGFLTVGTGSGQLTPSAGGVDVQTIKGQTITCSAGVTVAPFLGNATAALSVDASGRVDLGRILGAASAGVAGYVGLDWSHINAPTTAVNLSGTTISTSQVVASVTAAVNINLAQTLNAARALDGIADTALTINDVGHCAIAAAAGQEDASSGTSMVVKTPSTGTVLRNFTVNTAGTNPFGSSYPVSRT